MTENREGGRAALIRATVELLAESGPTAITYRSVARRAGVTHGLVRHHFQSLDALVRAAVAQWGADSPQATGLDSGTGRLADLGQRLIEDVRQRGLEHLAMYELIMGAARTGFLAEEVRQSYEGYVEAVGRALARAGLEDDENRSLARLVFAALDGLVVQSLVWDDPGALDRPLEVLHDLLESLERGASPSPT
ncbi:MAG: TetR/AcrR family transcriptional regulator [Bifidobacteriaceae bacterium]|nr:TetR/AcrR family transcriptional regulator [Bifidobacteriaceae bacterium]